MSSDDYLNDLAKRFGIIDAYQGFVGDVVETNRDTKKAILGANGLALDNDAMISEVWHYLKAGDESRLFPEELIVQSGRQYECRFGEGAKWRIVFDEQERSSFEGIASEQIILPPLPLGIGILTVSIGEDAQDITVISTQIGAPSIEDISGANKIWGLNTALYGLRSKRNQGLGDYHDMASLAVISAKAGADFVGFNPVHSIGYNEQEIVSPYSPSHRGFLDTRHIALDDIDGLRHCTRAKSILSSCLEQVNELRNSQLVDYKQHRQIHHRQLEELYQLFVENSEPDAVNLFDCFCHERGEYLEKFSLYEAISEVHGNDWHNWPDNLRNQKLSALNEVRKNSADRILFHSWLQWIADFQVSNAHKKSTISGMSFGLYLDLAVGMRQGGAEEWCEVDNVANGVSLGAPPDMMNSGGQNWNISGYAPRKLKMGRYKAFRQILKEAMSHCGILRIDHILGFYRSFWVPQDGSPGGYIKQPFDTLLAIAAMEAKTSNTVIIGEDLGLVPEGFREKIDEKGIYGYSVLQFEKNWQGAFTRPDNFREQSLACFGTHDTATLTGYWKGTDIRFWNSIGAIEEAEVANAKEQRRQDVNALMDLCENEGEIENQNMSDANVLTDKMHGALANSSAAMVSIQLNDILGEAEAQNYPGTVDQYPNWRIKCSKTLEEIDTGFLLESTGECMKKSGRGQIQRSKNESTPG